MRRPAAIPIGTRRTPGRMYRRRRRSLIRGLDKPLFSSITSQHEESHDGGGSLVGAVGRRELTLDGECEFGAIGVTDDATEPTLGFEHPGGGPPEAHLPQLRRSQQIRYSWWFLLCGRDFTRPPRSQPEWTRRDDRHLRSSTSSGT